MTPASLLHSQWNEGLKRFSSEERRSGFEWVKDTTYATGQPVGPLPKVRRNQKRFDG